MTYSVIHCLGCDFAVGPVLDFGLDVQLLVLVDEARPPAVEGPRLRLDALLLRLAEVLGGFPKNGHFPVGAHGSTLKTKICEDTIYCCCLYSDSECVCVLVSRFVCMQANFKLISKKQQCWKNIYGVN